MLRPAQLFLANGGLPHLSLKVEAPNNKLAGSRSALVQATRSRVNGRSTSPFPFLFASSSKADNFLMKARNRTTNGVCGPRDHKTKEIRPEN